MQSFVWFVSACRIWTGAILWALENEPEQIMVCCTGWKEDREDLSCSEGPRETQLQVTLCNQRQRQGSRHLDSYTIHTSACPSVPPNPLHTHRHRHYTTPDSQCKYCAPDKVITAYLEKKISGVLPWTDSSSRLGRSKNFPNSKCSASIN